MTDQTSKVIATAVQTYMPHLLKKPATKLVQGSINASALKIRNKA